MRLTTILLAAGLGLSLACGNCGGSDDAGPETTASEPAVEVGPVLKVVIALSDEEAILIDSRLVAPIERALNGEDDIVEIRSTAFPGRAEMFIRFSDGVADSYAKDILQRSLERVRRMPDAAGTPDVSVSSIPAGLQLRLKSSDIDALIEASQALTSTIGAISGVNGVEASMMTRADINIEYNEERIREYNMRSFGVAAQLEEAGMLDGKSPEELRAFTIQTRDGQSIPLSEIATIDIGLKPTRLDRHNGKRVAWIFVEASDEDAVRTELEALTSPHSAVTLSVR